MSTQQTTVTDKVADAAAQPVAGYAPSEERPLASYLVLTAAFGVALGGALAAAKASGRELERPGALDVGLAALATQKVSRLITKDKVTSFIRAPFTHYQEPSGHGELAEEPRGEGMRYALGELLVCPYCISQWVAGGLTAGWLYAPRTTRLLSAMWAVQSVADAAQLAYAAAEERA